MFTLIIALLTAYVLYRLYWTYFPPLKIVASGKYVLISGCDSGFGHALAIRLDDRGFNVLAGVFLSDGIASLETKLSSRATVFHLDITRQETIDNAFNLVKTKTSILHALVNNAGITTGGLVDWTSMDTIRQIMNVNFLGHAAMMKKFLPLLIAKRHSRVVNVSSMCGFISLPGSGAYCASKFALESFSDCLRREMYPWKLHVSIVEPGTMKTKMSEGLNQLLLDVWTQTPIDTQERWGESCFKALHHRTVTSVFLRYPENADKVVEALEDAVCSRSPRTRYQPGWQSAFVFYPMSTLPVWLLDKLLAYGFPIKPVGVTQQLNN